MSNVKLGELKEGMTVYTDDGFFCIEPGANEVKSGEHGLYIECGHGQHLLDGQLEDDEYIGIYHTDPFEGQNEEMAK